MTVKQFQFIGKIEATDDIDHLGFIICELFNLTVEQVEALPKRQQIKLANCVANQLLKVRTPKLFHPKFTLNAELITLGQFIEINAWLKKGVDEGLHLIAASILRKRKDHKKQAEKILTLNIREVLPYVETFLNTYNDLMLNYAGLFEVEVADDDDEETHPFIDDFGWLFTAKSIADHLAIELNKAYELNIIEALNVMAYLKSFNSYKEWQQAAT